MSHSSCRHGREFMKGNLMKTIVRMFLLIVLPVFICGFSDAGDQVKQCREAVEIVPSLAGLTGEELLMQEERIISLCPEGAPGHFIKGLRHEQEGKPELAAAEYRQALAAAVLLDSAASAQQRHSQMHGIKAEAYRKMGATLNADKEYALAGIAYVTEADKQIMRGDEYLLEREYDSAIEAYRTALRERPASTVIMQKLADAQMAAGRDEQAIEVYRQLLGLDEKNSNIRYMLGLLYERQGLLDEAEEQFLQVVKNDSNNGDARRHLADIYILRGNFPHAIREYRELITEYGDNPLLHFKLARAYERDKKYKEAIAQYLETIKLAPDNLEAHKELATLYVKRGKPDEAANQYRTVLRLNKEDTSARNALIGLYVQRRNFSQLFALVKEGAELFPDDPNSHFRLGLMHDFRKEYDASIAEYRKTLVLKIDHAKALKGLGKVYLKTGRLKDARECLEAARKADPNLLAASELLNDLMKVERKVKSRKKKYVKKGKSSKKKYVKERKSSKKKYVKKGKNGKKKYVKKRKSSKKKYVKKGKNGK